MIRAVAFIVLACLGVSILGCSGDERAPGVVAPLASGGRASGGRASTGGSSTGGSSSGGASGDGGTSGGAGGVASSGGTSNVPDAEAPACADASAPVAAAGEGAACRPESVWGQGVAVAGMSTVDEDRFGSMTFDELTIVWVVVAGGIPTIRYADRSSTAEPFFPSGVLTPGYYGGERPAVSADGSRVVVVRADGKALAEFTRAGRFSSFEATPSEAHFATLNNLGLTLADQERFGDPVLSEDDRALYFSRYGGDTSDRTVFLAARDGSVAWPVGIPLEGEVVRVSCGQRRRPTGISVDQLTLFYWDEVSGSQRATWRASLDAPFEGVVDLGTRSGAQPNAACTTLYHSGPGTGGADLFATAIE